MNVPAELNLVAACCRWPPSAERDALVRARAGAPIDWDAFGKTVRRHRVEGLVHAAAAKAGIPLPPQVAASLAAAAADTVRQNLLYAAESGRLCAMLEAANFPFLFLKGITLNILCYGSLGLKRAWDIDIAIETSAYTGGCALLEKAGYACILPGPGLTPDEMRASLIVNKHSIWKDRRGVAVELHSDLVDSPMMLPGLSVHSPRQIVAIGPGISLPTLRKEELFAYLCAHGAAHAWSRLKWLADLAALIQDDDEGEVERLYRRSLELGAGRSSAQALLLCARLFETRLPERLAKALGRDLRTRFLVRAALKSMSQGGPGVELDEMVLGTVSVHLSHLFLMPGWRYKAAELRRKLTPPISAKGAGTGRLLARVLRAPRWLLIRARTTRRARRG